MRTSNMRMAGLFAGAVLTVAGGCGSDSTPEGQQPQCAGQTFPATFEAESATLEGVQVSSERQGFSGSGYVIGFGDAGKHVSFQVCAPRSGYYTVEFGYAKGTDQKTTRTLVVDGNARPGNPVFSPLWTWSTWGSGGRRAIYLDAGNHAIALASQNADSGEIWLDKMVLSAGPSSSDVSVRSLFMNNWSDMLVGWHAAKLSPKDESGYGPRMTAFHWAKDWPTNQIDEAQAFLRDETAGTSYTDSNLFDTKAYFTASETLGYGEMRVEYGDYGGKAMPMSVTRRMIVPPKQNFVVVAYEIGNVTDSSRQFSIMEWADLHNKTAGKSEDPPDIPGTAKPSDEPGMLSALWYPQYNAWIADMSRTNGTFLVMGSFGPPGLNVAGAPVTGGPDRAADTVKQFAEGPSLLRASSSFSGQDVGIGMSKTITLESTQRATVAYFYGIADSMVGAEALAQSLQGGDSLGTWIDRSSSEWRNWLSSGRAVSLDAPVQQWAEALRVAMVTNRQSQQPEFGGFVAATNPAYSYKVWVRDASVTALGFDAAGYLDEAEKYWIWMADVQADGLDPNHPVGSWWTNYSFFAKNQEIEFVEPEHDAIGLFLIGAYRHHEALQRRDSDRARRFLETVWPALQKAADFVASRVREPDNFGFGAEDFSIWEEQLQFAVFTQTTYASGLRAAELLARQQGRTESADVWARASNTIRDSIFRDTSIDPCPGAWSAFKNYFIRGVNPDCTLDQRVDASTGLLWVFGLLDAKSQRAALHRRAILLNLARGEFGIARYEGDEFYHSSLYSPGGVNEANAPMPSWPQMSMYMTMLEHWLGMNDTADNRLSWYVATTNAGYQPPGEAIDWTTELPLVSTASEPVTSAWFGLALLNRLGIFDPRLHDDR
jgi:hypothetical protein